eukprot:IDg21712t1
MFRGDCALTTSVCFCLTRHHGEKYAFSQHQLMAICIVFQFPFAPLPNLQQGYLKVSNYYTRNLNKKYYKQDSWATTDEMLRVRTVPWYHPYKEGRETAF